MIASLMGIVALAILSIVPRVCHPESRRIRTGGKEWEMALVAEADVMEKRLIAGISGAVGAGVTKTWHFVTRPAGPMAPTFLTLTPAKRAREALAMGLPTATVWALYFRC